MADYRDLAIALGGGYGQDTGPITPDTLIALKNGKTANTGDLLGMLKGIGQSSNNTLESLGQVGMFNDSDNVDLSKMLDEPSKWDEILGGAKDFVKNTATPALQTGLDSVLPFRKMGNIAIDQGIVKPVQEAAKGFPNFDYASQYAAAKNADDLRILRMRALIEGLGGKVRQGERNWNIQPEYTYATRKNPKQGQPK